MASVYILYSKSADAYYTGSCKDLGERLNAHRSKEYSDSFTAKLADDWELYFHIDGLGYEQSRCIEQHTKRMKSRKYIENLLRYPEISERLVEKYK